MTTLDTFSTLVRASNARAKDLLLAPGARDDAGDTAQMGWANRPQAVRTIHKNWQALLGLYHEELDTLREDWALETFGRSHMRGNYRPSRDPGPDFGRWFPQRIKESMVGGAVYRRLYRLRYGLAASEDVVNRPFWVVNWRSLQRKYMERKKIIDEKYTRLLGIRVLTGQWRDQSRFFPVHPADLLWGGWPEYYPGQNILQVRTRLGTSPPDYDWHYKIEVLGRDGKFFCDCGYKLRGRGCREAVERWKGFGFTILNPKRT
ncbi:hypothetical protein QBC46DRAFT_449513 [Diplogelasinospora grovesii]|uniref:Uncharacterized protein n=1 Tax=Diplogelasinospora grovesii TaxID=303347 RepID=A0AAN6S4P4_9PEZI|nr:hypothetical protein QBC46DRAFT_449513 [Diplogelasinospora grovesii]